MYLASTQRAKAILNNCVNRNVHIRIYLARWMSVMVQFSTNGVDGFVIFEIVEIVD